MRIPHVESPALGTGNARMVAQRLRKRRDVEDAEQVQTAEQRLNHNLKSVWLLIGVCIIIVVIGFIIGSIATAIWTLVVAGVVVFILRRPVRWLSNKGLPRPAASGILTVALVAAIVAVFVSFVPLIIDQLSSLASALPTYIGQAQQWYTDFLTEHPEFASNTVIQTWVAQFLDGIRNATTGLEASVISWVYSAGMSLANIIMYGFMAFMVAFWILIDYDKMAHEMHILAGRTSEWYLILFSTIFSRVLGGYLKGTLITALAVAVISGIGYAIAGLPFAVVLGILMGLFSIVPYLGPIFATIIIAVLAVFSGPFAFFFSLVISILVPWLVSSFVSPKIMSTTVNLHPGIIMVSIIAGGALGGVAGMILAIPVMGAAKCIFVYFFEAITGRQLVGKTGALFDGNPTDVIDPVADATDNFLTTERLKAQVEGIEEHVRKVEDAPKREAGSLFQELAQPMEHISARKIEMDFEEEAPAEESAPDEEGASVEEGASAE